MYVSQLLQITAQLQVRVKKETLHLGFTSPISLLNSPALSPKLLSSSKDRTLLGPGNMSWKCIPPYISTKKSNDLHALLESEDTKVIKVGSRLLCSKSQSKPAQVTQKIKENTPAGTSPLSKEERKILSGNLAYKHVMQQQIGKGGSLLKYAIPLLRGFSALTLFGN